MRKWYRYFVIFMSLGVLVLLLAVKKFAPKRDEGVNPALASTVASRAVQLMFSYDTPQELNENMTELKSLCTDEVFKNLSIDNEERSLRTYLQFVDNKCAVQITAKTDDYIIYCLVSDYVKADREFIMLYQVDENGLICYAKEAELINGMGTFSY